MKQQLTIICTILLLFSLLLVSCQTDRIHMSEIQALTFRRDGRTTSNKGQYYPQLNCNGGDAQYTGYQPEVIQCKNVGFDGISQQWECSAEMDDNYRLGKVHVVCEGYSGPGDAYVVKGSCSLDYELNFTPKGKRNQADQQQQHRNGAWSAPPVYRRNNVIYEDNDKSGNTWVFFLVIAVIVFIIAMALSSGSGRRSSPTYVPPYNPNYTSDSGVYTSDRRSTSSSGIGTTGAFIGGLATGYMAGRSTSSGHTSNNTYYATPTYSNSTSSTYSTSSSRKSSDNSGSGVHVSKGFGGSSSR